LHLSFLAIHHIIQTSTINTLAILGKKKLLKNTIFFYIYVAEAAIKLSADRLPKIRFLPMITNIIQKLQIFILF